MTLRIERSANFRFTHFAMWFASSLFLLAASASAATIQVDTLSDEADGIHVGGVSLHDAINEANGTSEPDIIAIGIEGTITLVEDLPIITTDVEIRGDAPGGVVINGNGQFRAFVIQNPSATLTIRNVTIANCLTFPGDVSGAAGGISTGAAILLLSGRLIVDSTSFIDNTTSSGSGGAIYASDGMLELIDCTFERNASIGGVAGNGSPAFVGGQGGALYVHADAAAFGAELQFGTGSDSNWATHDANAIGDDDEIFGTVRALPVVLSILRLGVSRTRLDHVTYVVAFSESVSGVDATDFSLVTTGVSGAAITSVEDINGGTYAVTIATGTGSGTIGLQLNDDDSIRNMESLSLGGVGIGNGDFVADDEFTIDRTRPEVASIDSGPNQVTNPGEMTFIVSFSEPVTDFDDAGDVHIEHAGTIHEAIEFTRISDTTIEVTLYGVTGEGEIELFVKSGAATDFVGNPNIVGSAAGRIRFDDVPPRLASSRVVDDTAGSARLVFELAFSEPVSNITEKDVLILHSHTSHDAIGIVSLNQTTTQVELTGVAGIGEVTLQIHHEIVTDAFGYPLAESVNIPVSIAVVPLNSSPAPEPTDVLNGPSDVGFAPVPNNDLCGAAPLAITSMIPSLILILGSIDRRLSRTVR